MTEAVSKHTCNTCLFAKGGTHPKDVVVSPLNINGRMFQKQIEYLMGFGTAVVDIADNMKPVNSKLLNCISKSYNDGLGIVVANNGIEYLIIIAIQIVEAYARG